jgi:hypothetical protein
MTRKEFDEDAIEQKQRLIKMGGDPGSSNTYQELTSSQQGEAVQESAAEFDQAEKARNLAGQSTSMAGMSKVFRSVIDMMAQLNEAMSANNYIHDTIEAELDRVGRLNADARKEVYKAQQHHMETSYAKSYRRFSTGVILFTIIASALLSMIVAAWMQGLFGNFIFYVVLAAVAVGYALMMVLFFGLNRMRRQLHWNQFYWGSPEPPEEDEGDCDIDD